MRCKSSCCSFPFHVGRLSLSRYHYFHKNCLKIIHLRYIFYTMKFEFDPKKSLPNREKHGIDFAEARKLWDDPDLLQVSVRTVDEERFLVIGRIGEKYWSGVITYRCGNIRIISIRRARKEEIELYES